MSSGDAQRWRIADGKERGDRTGDTMIKGFEFSADDRHYVCTIETQRGAEDDPWWWFAVSGDAQRYAPFRAVGSDTRATVQERIVAFYSNRLFQLTQPRLRGAQFGSRRPAAKPASPAAGSAPA